MVKDKGAQSSRQGKIDRFAVVGVKPCSQEESTLPGDSEPDRFAEILSAIQASRLALECQIGGVQTEVLLVRQDLQNVIDSFIATDFRILDLEDTISTLCKETSRDQARLRKVAWRVDDAENRAQHINLRFVRISRRSGRV